MLRILIADDHPIVRRGLKQILEDEPDIQEVGEADSAAAVLDKMRGRDWDLLVLDLSMPGRGGLDLLKDLRYQYPKLPVIILSVYPEEQYAVRSLKAGASGYLTKEMAPEELLKAIRKAVSGGKYVSPTLAERLAMSLDEAFGRLPHESLSDRELQVLLLIASGKSVTDISADLHLSVKTVSTYRTRILEKMGMDGNADLIRYALQNGLVE